MIKARSTFMQVIVVCMCNETLDRHLPQSICQQVQALASLCDMPHVTTFHSSWVSGELSFMEEMLNSVVFAQNSSTYAAISPTGRWCVVPTLNFLYKMSDNYQFSSMNMGKWLSHSVNSCFIAATGVSGME